MRDIEKEKIENVIGKVESYTLVNNYGYKNDKYDIEHVVNVYGQDCNFWELDLKDNSKKSKTYYNLDDLLNDLKKENEVK